MIDWFKIELMNRPADELRAKFDFIKPVNMKTGEILGTYEIAYLRIHDVPDCSISVKIFRSGRVWVQGSIHKFWHGQNHSIFTIDEAQKAFVRLLEILEVNPVDTKILQMEYGVNLYTPFNPDVFIDRLICLKSKPFEGLGNYDKIGKVCYQSEYDLKIYNKSRQYHLKNNILRIEKKIKDSRYLKRWGINAIADITDAKAAEMMQDLCGILDDVIFNDKSIDETNLTTRQKLALSKYRNPTFWNEISKSAKLNAKKRFSNLIIKFGSENYLNLVDDLLKNPFNKYVGSGDLSDNIQNNEAATFPNFKYGSEKSFLTSNKY